MFHLTDLNFATIILDVSAVFLVFGILRQTRFMRRRGQEADRLFFKLLITTVVMAAADIGGYLTIGYADPVAVWIQILSMTLFYVAFTLLSMFWLDYCLFKFKNAQKRKTGMSLKAATGSPRRSLGAEKIAYLPGIVVIVLIIVNVFTGYIFFVDEQGIYHRGFLFIPMYVILAAYIVAGIVMIAKYRTAGKRKLIPLWLYVMPLAVCILITFVSGEISMAAFGAAVTIAFTHLGTMNEVAEISIGEMTKQ